MTCVWSSRPMCRKVRSGSEKFFSELHIHTVACASTHTHTHPSTWTPWHVYYTTHTHTENTPPHVHLYNRQQTHTTLYMCTISCKPTKHAQNTHTHTFLTEGLQSYSQRDQRGAPMMEALPYCSPSYPTLSEDLKSGIKHIPRPLTQHFTNLG